MSSSKRLLAGIAVVVSFSSLCHSQDIASDFEQVLGALREKAVRPRWNLYYYDMKDAVNGFIAKHTGPSDRLIECLRNMRSYQRLDSLLSSSTGVGPSWTTRR